MQQRSGQQQSRWKDCSSGSGGYSPKGYWCTSPRHLPSEPQDRNHQFFDPVAKDQECMPMTKQSMPLTIWAMVFAAKLCERKGIRRIAKKVLITSNAPITKQPTLPKRLSTTGTMLTSRNFQISRSNHLSIPREAMSTCHCNAARRVRLRACSPHARLIIGRGMCLSREGH